MSLNFNSVNKTMTTLQTLKVENQILRSFPKFTLHCHFQMFTFVHFNVAASHDPNNSVDLQKTAYFGQGSQRGCQPSRKILYLSRIWQLNHLSCNELIRGALTTTSLPQTPISCIKWATLSYSLLIKCFVLASC